MVVGERKNLSFTGLKDFYYGELDGDQIKGTEAVRINFLQEISVSTPQELVKAYGDNGIAEMAVSTNSTTLTTTFHALPIEDKAVIYGMIEKTGVFALPGNPKPPYVACMFTKTREDGSTEHIGFTKGKFMIADDEAVTKGETVEFGKGTTEGQFMSRKVEGFDEDISFLVSKDQPGAVVARDELYQMIFGVPFPVEVV